MFRISAPELPTWQDCHELWWKKRKKALQNLPPGKPPVLGRDGKPFIPKPDDSMDVGG